MIPRTARLAPLAALAALGCLGTTELADWSGDGGQDTDPGDIIAMDCGDCPAVGDAISNLRCALDLCDPSAVRNGDGDYVAVTDYRSNGVAFSECTLDDTRAAIARFGVPGNDLVPDALNGAYAIMATGDWDADPHVSSCSPVAEEDLGTDDALEYDGNSKLNDTIYDAVEWRLELRAPDDAKSFGFDYVFFSTEYDEGISGLQNDKFYAEIKAPSTNEGEATVINFTACRDEDAYYDFVCGEEDDPLEQACTQGVKYCYIAINSALSECCYHAGCPDGTAETSIDGTGYECGTAEDDGTGHGSSTGWLRTRWPIDPGEEFTLTFHIHDTNDSGWDSAVILDGFRFYRSFSSGGTVVIE